MDRAKELAENHWEWVRGLLESLQTPEFIVDVIAFFYITAFEHGYKHAMQDKQKEES